MSQDVLMNTYNRLPLTFTHGSGAYLYADDGKRYLDALSGIGVCNLGHAHPAITQAITEQAGKLLHTSNIYRIAAQEKAAAALQRVCGMQRVFFANSGAEANEAAIKLARLYGHKKNIANPTIIVMEQSFHGRTMATLSATGNRKIQAGFEPLVMGFTRAPYNDIQALRSIAANNSQVVAILVEPVQGEGGVNIPNDDYLPALRELCDQHDWLLMLDEVQTGNGRTGAYFAYQHHQGLTPDVLTAAKGLGNGVPVGACLTWGKAADVLAPGNHGSTFGGNPLACATVDRVIMVIEQDQLCARAASLGQVMLERLRDELRGNRIVKQVRGKGLMLGIELHKPCAELVKQALPHGLLINVTAEKTIRLLPPLIISDEQAEFIVTTVVSLVRQFSEAQ